VAKKNKQRREQQQGEKMNSLVKFYHDHYKWLLIIPIALLILAFVQIGVQTSQTGDFVNRGITLTGGVVVTVTVPAEADISTLQAQMQAAFPDNEVLVREFISGGTAGGIIVESNIVDEEQRLALIEQVRGLYDQPLPPEAISNEATGSTLGEDFFRQTMFVILIAYVFMAIIVFITFRKFVPSMLVVLAAFANLIITLGIFNILGFRLSSAGIAAFLMVIGYSVDTDILLTSRVLKHGQGSIFQRIISACKTGSMMSISTIAAVTVTLIISSSALIQEIMIIVLIGLVVDYINTWLLNAGLLRWVMERGTS